MRAKMRLLYAVAALASASGLVAAAWLSAPASAAVYSAVAPQTAGVHGVQVLADAAIVVLTAFELRHIKRRWMRPVVPARRKARPALIAWVERPYGAEEGRHRDAALRTVASAIDSWRASK
jgi:hypothetical protein